MIIIEKIRQLLAQGVELKTIAQYCNCAPLTLRNYLKGISTPTPRLQNLMEQGVKQYYNEIKKIIEN